MTHGGEVMAEAEHVAKRTAEQARPWLVRLARLGYLARAALYLTIGTLAVRAAIGAGGRATDTRGALRSWIAEPFGQILLGLSAAGLAGYALWQFCAAAFDPERVSRKRQGALASAAARVRHAAVGVIHAGLAVSAVQLLTGAGDGGRGSDATSRHWVARVLEQPFGPWLVGLAGAAVVVGGAWQVVRAVRAQFRKGLVTAEMTPAAARAVTALGRVGIAARGLVFAVAGAFAVQAARHANAHEARGFGGALRALARAPMGAALFAAVAAGLLAFGAFELVEARYRQIEVV